MTYYLLLVAEANYWKYNKGVKALGSCQTDVKPAQFELNKQKQRRASTRHEGIQQDQTHSPINS
jgi:hypothetical protein